MLCTADRRLARVKLVFDGIIASRHWEEWRRVMSGEMADDFKYRRNGDVYVVTDEEKQSFKTMMSVVKQCYSFKYTIEMLASMLHPPCDHVAVSRTNM
jgi:uncharacterized hydantoinase/oxoprolinase family protein